MKRLLAVVVVGLVVYLGWRWLSDGDDLDGGENPALIQKYVWGDKDLERMPPRDFAHMFALPEAVDDQGRTVGGVLKASHYDLHLRLFEHALRGNRARVKFLQDGKTAELRFRITRCREGLCLELDRSPWGGPRRYFAIGEIHGRGVEALEAELRRRH